MKSIFLIALIFVSKVHSDSRFPVCDPVEPSWHPHPDYCERFFICFWGNLVERHCAPGLHYNRETTQCMEPELAGCVLDYTPVCDVPDDPNVPVFHPHIDDCTRYFLCFNGSAIRRECAAGLYWDVIYDWCDFPHRVTCDENTSNNPNPPTGTPGTTTQSTTTTTVTTTTPNPDFFNCPVLPGQFRYPHTRDCNRYFICDNGVAFLRVCGDGLLFDHDIVRDCVPWEEAECFPGSTPPPHMTTTGWMTTPPVPAY